MSPTTTTTTETAVSKTTTTTMIATKESMEKFKPKIVLLNVFGFIILHVWALYAYVSLMLLDPEIHWYHIFLIEILVKIGLLGILAGAHRLWSHRSYKARLPLRIFLMILQTWSGQNDILTWARDHRLHHKHSDTDADPHNINRGFFFAHMGWLLYRKHPDVIQKGKTIDNSDLMADPVVRFQRKNFWPLIILFWGALPIYLFYLTTGFSFWKCFCCAVILRYVISLHYTWTVNSVAHTFGYKPYDRELIPNENPWISYVTWGEGYHNYHHAFPYDYSASEHGFEQCFNIATAFIDFCSWIGLVYERKKASNESILKRIERKGDTILLRRRISGLADYFLGTIGACPFFILTLAIRIFICCITTTPTTTTATNGSIQEDF